MEQEARKRTGDILGVGVGSSSNSNNMADEITRLKSELDAEKRCRQEELAKSAVEKAALED